MQSTLSAEKRFIILLNTNGVVSSHVIPPPEVPVYKRWGFLPALLGLRFQETVVHMDRVGQVHSALLATFITEILN